jgi:hypothetical protein
MQRYNYFLIPQTFREVFFLKSEISFLLLIYIKLKEEDTLLYYMRANNNFILQEAKNDFIHKKSARKQKKDIQKFGAMHIFV